MGRCPQRNTTRSTSVLHRSPLTSTFASHIRLMRSSVQKPGRYHAVLIEYAAQASVLWLLALPAGVLLSALVLERSFQVRRARRGDTNGSNSPPSRPNSVGNVGAPSEVETVA